MMRRRLVLALVLVLAVLPLLAARPTAAQTFRVALVLPGSIADKGFNQSAYDGLKLVEKELGVKTAYSEKTPTEKFARTFRDFADDGNNVIIGHGFEFADVAVKVAKDYPKTYFVVTNHPGVDNPPPNVAFIQPSSKDSAFLVGVAAGLATKSGVVGAVAGFDFPTIIAQIEAIRMGVKAVNPKAELRPVYIGTFDDATVGKEAAKSLIAAKADVVYQIADAAGLGVIQAAQEAKVWAIGWGLDQHAVAPDTMLTTQIVDTGKMMVEEIKLIQDGKFKAGAKFFGLDTGVVGYAPLNDKAKDLAPAMENVAAALKAGLINVPYFDKQDAAKDLPGGWLVLSAAK